MNQIIVIGAGGHARVVADLIRLLGEFELRGFLDQTNPDRHLQAFEGSRILGADDMLDELLEEGMKHAAIAVGDNEARARIGDNLLSRGFELPPLVHPRATVASTVDLEAGVVVCAGAVINAATTIGGYAIINTCASVDHDCTIGAGVHIAPGAHLGGNVTVGEQSLIGLGAAIKPGVRIGNRVVVGVGAAVVSDVADDQTVAGVPARVMP